MADLLTVGTIRDMVNRGMNDSLAIIGSAVALAIVMLVAHAKTVAHIQSLTIEVLNTRIDDANARVNDLNKRIDGRCKEIERQLQQINKRLDEVDRRLAKHKVMVSFPVGLTPRESAKPTIAKERVVQSDTALAVHPPRSLDQRKRASQGGLLGTTEVRRGR